MREQQGEKRAFTKNGAFERLAATSSCSLLENWAKAL